MPKARPRQQLGVAADLLWCVAEVDPTGRGGGGGSSWCNVQSIEQLTHLLCQIVNALLGGELLFAKALFVGSLDVGDLLEKLGLGLRQSIQPDVGQGVVLGWHGGRDR